MSIGSRFRTSTEEFIACQSYAGLGCKMNDVYNKNSLTTCAVPYVSMCGYNTYKIRNALFKIIVIIIILSDNFELFNGLSQTLLLQ